MSWSQLNAGATIPHEHATGCNSMQIPSSKQDTSWAPLGCSGETCSLSEEAKSRTATASRASCHETRTTGESLPHFHRCVSSGGALPSTAVYDDGTRRAYDHRKFCFYALLSLSTLSLCRFVYVFFKFFILFLVSLSIVCLSACLSVSLSVSVFLFDLYYCVHDTWGITNNSGSAPFSPPPPPPPPLPRPCELLSSEKVKNCVCPALLVGVRICVHALA